MTTPEQAAAAKELGIDPGKLNQDGDNSQDAPEQRNSGAEFQPDFDAGQTFEQKVISKDQYKAPLKQAFGGIAYLRGEHWQMGDDEAAELSAAAVKAFPETEMPPKMQFFSMLLEAIGMRIYVEMESRPENQAKDVTPGAPKPENMNGTQGGETFG